MTVESFASERFEGNASRASLSLPNIDRMDLLVSYPFEQNNASQPYLPSLHLFDGSETTNPSGKDISTKVDSCRGLDTGKDYGQIAFTQRDSDKTLTSYANGSTKMEGSDGSVNIWDAEEKRTVQQNTDGSVTATYQDGSTFGCHTEDGTSEIHYDSNYGAKNSIVEKPDGTIEHTVETAIPQASSVTSMEVSGTQKSFFTEKPNGDLAMKASVGIGDQTINSDEIVLKRKDLPDETKTYTSDDNSVQIRMSPDKTITETYKLEEGEYRLVAHPDGSYEQSMPDGSKSRRLTDGTVEIETPNDPQTRFARVNPDGSVFSQDVDGSTQLLNTNGTAALSKDGVEEHRRIAITLDNGRRLHPDFSDDEPTVKMPDGSIAHMQTGDDGQPAVVDSKGKQHDFKIDPWSDASASALITAKQNIQQREGSAPQAMSVLSNSN